MFEDSTFESTGRIRTRSRGWMIAAFTFNGSILLALILIPLIYPEALPRQMIAFLMEVPPPPPTQQPLPRQQPTRVVPVSSEMMLHQLVAPRTIPREPFIPSSQETALPVNVASWDPEGSVPGGTEPIFHGQNAHPIVRQEVNAPIRVSSMVVEGLLVHKTIPVYPPIGVETRTQGTVVLQATISKAGTIENLRVAGGPPVLQQAALDAVKTWRYRPYLLDGQPVEVETTINVIFSLGH
jgi:protein TonB